jgi:hypothetical protein
MNAKPKSSLCTESDEYLRLPGLFRRWEFEQVIDGNGEFHIEAAGATADGSTLFAVYHREHPQPSAVSR